MAASNDDLVFLDDSEDDSEDVADLQSWRVLVVDDDQDVHEATCFGLAHLLILGGRWSCCTRTRPARRWSCCSARGHRRHPALTW